MKDKISVVVELKALFRGFDEEADKYVLNRASYNHLIGYTEGFREVEMIMPESKMTRMQKEAVKEFATTEWIHLHLVAETIEELLETDSAKYQKGSLPIVYLLGDENLLGKYEERYLGRVIYKHYAELS